MKTVEVDVIICGFTKPINPWLGRQFWNQTFEDDVEVKIEEIQQLLDMDEDCGEAESKTYNG